MKHRVYGKHFGRNKDERDRLFKSLVQSLFLHGTIETSSTKASAIKGSIDKIINLAKVKSRQHLLQSYLVSKQLRERLIKEIVPKMENRTSGYTKLVRLGERSGDNTMMVRMSLIGAEQLKSLEKVIGNKLQSTVIKKTMGVKKEEKVVEKKGRTGQSVRQNKLTRKGTSRLSK